MANFNSTRMSRMVVLIAMLGLLTLGSGCAPRLVTSDITGNRLISVSGTTFSLPRRWEALPRSEQQYWRISAEDIAFYSPLLAHKAMGRCAPHREPYITITHILDPVTVADIKKRVFCISSG